MRLILLVLLMLAFPAWGQDRWGGPDKIKHVGVSCVFGIGSSLVTKTWWGAFGLAMIPGTLKETRDATIGIDGTGWSWKDMAANAVGAGLCVSGTRVILQRAEGRTVVALNWSLP